MITIMLFLLTLCLSRPALAVPPNQFPDLSGWWDVTYTSITFVDPPVNDVFQPTYSSGNCALFIYAQQGDLFLGSCSSTSEFSTWASGNVFTGAIVENIIHIRGVGFHGKFVPRTGTIEGYFEVGEMSGTFIMTKRP